MRCDGRNTFLGIGGNRDIVIALLDTYEYAKLQPVNLLKNLYDCDYYTQLWSIWQYFIDHVYYKEDEGNKQYLKTPARILRDGKGDCKSFSIFFASCLHCLGIPFVFRFVGFNAQRPRTYTHVYVVANPNTSAEVILDAVETDSTGMPIFNYARNYVTHKDIAA